MYKILITGAGSVMGQSIYRALCESPYAQQMSVLFTNSDPLGAGFYFDAAKVKYPIPISKRIIAPLATHLSYTEFIHDIIRKENIDIVYSGTQHELRKLAELNDVTGNIAVTSTQVIDLCLDKHLTCEYLASKDIPTPRSFRLKDLQTKANDLQFSNYPIIVKPNSSSASRNIFKVANNEEMKEVLAEIPNGKLGNYVAQEFLTGDEYTCAIYLDRFARWNKYLVMKRELSQDGASIYGKLVQIKEIDIYLSRIAEAFREYGHGFGNLNVQLRLTEDGPKLFEINGRLSSTEAPKARFGFNSSAAFFENIVLKKESSVIQPFVSGSFLRYYEEVIFDEDRAV